MQVLRIIGNVLWLVFAGAWLAIAYAVAGLVMFVLIITIPFGVQAFKLAGYAIWPFGRVVVDAESDRSLSAAGNVIWVLLAGWWLALLHLVVGTVLCVTIIGIPFGIASFKMAWLAIVPFGREVVHEDDVRALTSARVVRVGGYDQPRVDDRVTVGGPVS